MSATLGVLILVLCILSTNGGKYSVPITNATLYSSTLLPEAVSTTSAPVENKILLNDTELELLFAATNRSRSRTPPVYEKGFDLNQTERDKFKIWPEGHIPYFLDMYSFDLEQEMKIIETFEKYNNLTGLNFYPLPEALDEDVIFRWILFVNRKGFRPCLPYTANYFTNEGVQRVFFGFDCFSTDVGMASLVLAIAGVPPQHNSPNRDEYIEILWNNIIPARRQVFTKLNNSDWLFHDIKYDFSSAGHFPNTIYTIDGNVTYNLIKKPDYLEMKYARIQGLSHLDIKKIKMMYNYINKNRTYFLNETRKSNNDIDIVDDGLPRAKPNLYLGLPDPITTTKAATATKTTTTTTTTEMAMNFRRRRNRLRPYRRRPEQIVNDLLLAFK